MTGVTGSAGACPVRVSGRASGAASGWAAAAWQVSSTTVSSSPTPWRAKISFSARNETAWARPAPPSRASHAASLGHSTSPSPATTSPCPENVMSPVGRSLRPSCSASHVALARISASVAGPTFSELAPSSSRKSIGGLVRTRMLAGFIPSARHWRQKARTSLTLPSRLLAPSGLPREPSNAR